MMTANGVERLGVQSEIQSGAVTGPVGALLRIEGAVVMGASALAYGQTGYGWGLFALLFLLPDSFMLGYLRDKRLGAALYNLGHTYTVPMLLGGATLWAGATGWLAVALIWVAHIGFDRMLGYGLKYATGFAHSHLSSARAGA